MAIEANGTRSTPGWRALQAELSFEWLLAGSPLDDVRAAAHRALGDADRPYEGHDALPFYDAVAALSWADDLELAGESVDRALAEAERSGRLMVVATACFRRAIVMYLCGAIGSAVADAQRAVDASALGWAAYLPAAQGVLALGLIERGELSLAAAVLEREGSGALETTTLPAAIFFQARSVLNLAEGAATEALEDALAAGRIMTEDLGALTPAVMPWRSLAALAHHRLGDWVEARRLAAEETELARAFGARRAIGISLRTQGMVAESSRRTDLLREAVRVLAGSPARPEHARALAELGSALARTGRSEGVDTLRQGLELADTCGACALVDRIERELKTAGARVPRRKRRSPTALTPAEERVALLVADGLSNKDVAQKLFVSVRAVEFHLGNVYTKLGISSRRQLPASLERR
jgi:DNA-binding CsgD family transcriptional regulator